MPLSKQHLKSLLQNLKAKTLGKELIDCRSYMILDKGKNSIGKSTYKFST